MSKPWRNTASALFFSALLFGAFWGDNLLAVDGETRARIKVFTEILQTAHEAHGEEVEYRELVYGSIRGMLRTLDPHTNFLSPEDYLEMRERQQGSFFGLGILVSMRNGQLTVISPIEGTPAWRLGLRAGDIISTIEGEPTDTMELDEAVGKLKGPKDTQVNLTITRRSLDEPLAVAITRAEIPQNTVRFSYMMDPRTGYLRLTDFSRSTSREVEDAVTKLQSEGMERLILDLRSNGGGLLDQTVSVSNLFVPTASRIVETRGRIADSHQDYLGDADSTPLAIPIVVLVNHGTASAAEILAGAIQDHDIGLVIGVPTWGKGLVQTVYNLSYGSGVALTTAKYYTPSGRLIQRDYSSFYDYYTHFQADDEEAAGLMDNGPEYRTDIGRKVYGGGGITPDIVVKPKVADPTLQLLYARNAFFDFAVDYQSKAEVNETSWQPPAELTDEFRQWLLDHEIAKPEKLDEFFADAELRQFAKRQIHGDIFNSAFGLEASHLVTARGDVQIQAAFEHFEEAAKLLDQRLNMDPLDRPRLAVATGDQVEDRTLPQ